MDMLLSFRHLGKSYVHWYFESTLPNPENLYMFKFLSEDLILITMLGAVLDPSLSVKVLLWSL